MQIGELRDQLTAAIEAGNQSLRLVLSGDLELRSGIVRVHYMMTFRNRLVKECNQSVAEADRLIDWETVTEWCRRMQQLCSESTEE